MSLQNERGEPTRRNWLARFSRERLDLSASVEETLRDERTIIQQDPLASVDADTPSTSLETSQHSKVISPRLTLQSGPVPLVRSLPSAQTLREDKEQKTGLFARLIRRGTASMPVPGSVTLPEPASPTPLSPQVPATTTSHPVAPPTGPQSLAGTVTEESQMLPAIHKANGRPTKIRLETAPGPAIDLQAKKLASELKREIGAQMLSPESDHERDGRAVTSDMQALDISARIPTTPHAGFPILDLYRLDSPDDSMKLPAVSVVEEPQPVPAPKREALSGSGVFEVGQRDVMLENSHVTATSVVLVMLKSNPGPAVVHYVSLQPSVGFTVHLSAPTTVPTAFNYIILLGELF